ncbi:MAG: class I SAM-dependent methyltransferase [Chloroflexota bacterium]
MNDWSCPLCDSVEKRYLFTTYDAMHAVDRPFAVVCCEQCHLYSLCPRPQEDELLSLYPEDYEPFWEPIETDPHPIRRWFRKRHFNYRRRIVYQAQPAGGTLLDIGCATGGFVKETCRNPNWQGAGVDINTRALQIARQQGVAALCNDTNLLGFPSESFDVVTLWEVIEHLPDPRQTLIEIHRVLKPGGRLILSTPNGASWPAHLLHKYWCSWEVPRHLQVFTPTTLAHLFQETGFGSTRRVVVPMERFVLMESARRWINERWNGWRHRIGYAIVSMGGLAAWPLLHLADYMPSASSLVIEAHRIENV